MQINIDCSLRQPRSHWANTTITAVASCDCKARGKSTKYFIDCNQLIDSPILPKGRQSCQRQLAKVKVETICSAGSDCQLTSHSATRISALGGKQPELLAN